MEIPISVNVTVVRVYIMRKVAWRFPLALTLPSYEVSLKFPNSDKIYDLSYVLFIQAF